MSEKHLRVIECMRMPNSASEEESDEEDAEDTEPGEEEESGRGKAVERGESGFDST